MNPNITFALKLNFKSVLLLSALFLYICIFCNQFKIFMIKIPKYLLFIYLI